MRVRKFTQTNILTNNPNRCPLLKCQICQRAWWMMTTPGPSQVSNQGAQVNLVRRCVHLHRAVRRLMCSQSEDTGSEDRTCGVSYTYPHQFRSERHRDLKLGSNTRWNHDISRGWWRVIWGCWAVCHWHHLELGKVTCKSSACVEVETKSMNYGWKG